MVAVLMKKCFKLSSSHFESCDYSKVTPISILFGVALDIFKNNSLFEASCTGTSKRERMRCTGSALQMQPVRLLHGACLVSIL